MDTTSTHYLEPNPSIPHIAVVISRFNEEITTALLSSFKKSLFESGWKEHELDIFAVPGAFEIPYLTQKLARKKQYRAIVTFGCVIKGETAHFEYICDSVSHGLQRVSLDEGIPILFGILTTYTEEQAKARTFAPLDKGKELAESLKEILKVC